MAPGSVADQQCGALCMCNVCECGLHKCPSKHTSAAVHYPSDLGSEYRQTYIAWPRQRRASSCRTEATGSAKDATKFVGITTNMVDYAPKKMPARAAPARDPSANHNNNNNNNNCIGDGGQHPLDSRTTYNGTFWDKSKQLPRRVMPTHGSINTTSGAPFYGETTHHADFGPKPMPKRAPPAAVNTTGSSSSSHVAELGAKFNGETTYHDTYKKWPLAARRGDVKKSPEPATKFSGETMYHTDFKAPKLPKRCPVLSRRPPSFVDGDHMVYEEK